MYKLTLLILKAFVSLLEVLMALLMPLVKVGLARLCGLWGKEI